MLESPEAAEQVSRRRVSIIVPVFNEAPAIPSFLSRLETVLEGVDAEVIVVDDGSTDKTSEVIREADASFILRLHRHERNRGKGAALKTGTRRCSGDIVVFLDGDGDIDPVYVLSALNELSSSAGLDFVVARRKFYDGGTVSSTYALRRRFFSILYSLLVKRLLGTANIDTQSGLKVFRADVLRQVIEEVETDSFAFDVELISALLQRKKKWGEISISISYASQSTVLFGSAFRALQDLIRIAIRVHKRKWRQTD